MKKALVILLIALLVMPFAAEGESLFTPGTYEGSSSGFHGPIHVKVEVTEDEIQSVETLEQEESFGIGDAAFPVLEESVVRNQSLADVVTGATITSYGFRNAVINALKEAGTTEETLTALKTAPVSGEAFDDCETDIVIVGAGAAGMIAAMQASDAGAKVILLEKNVMAGGSTRLSAGGILWTEPPENNGGAPTEYTVEDIHRWYSIQAGPVNNDPVFYAVMNHVPSMMDYIQGNGMALAPAGYNQPKNAPIFRATNPKQFGVGVYEALMKAVESRGIDYRNRSKVTALLQETDGCITGVAVETSAGTYNIRAKKVILATGGYTYDKELMQTYSTKWADAMKIAASGTTGDGHRMGMEAGGHMIGEGVLDIYISGYDPSLYGGQPGYADLIVDSEGNQLGAMDEYYGTLTVKAQNRPDHVAYQIFSSGNTYVEFDRASEELTFAMKLSDLDALVERGIMVKADTVEELAEKIGIDPAALARTVEEHNWYYDLKINDAWGTAASALQEIRKAPYYAARLTPCVMGTVAGLEVNETMQVVDEEGNPIPNLYAAGELIFGNVFNQIYPMAGTGIGIALSSGSIAGISASQAAQ